MGGSSLYVRPDLSGFPDGRSVREDGGDRRFPLDVPLLGAGHGAGAVDPLGGFGRDDRSRCLFTSADHVLRVIGFGRLLFVQGLSDLSRKSGC